MTAIADHPTRRVPPDVDGDRHRLLGAGGALAVGTVVLSGLLAALAGAWGIPRTDDWAFARVSYTLSATGHVRLVGWGQMNLVGLVAWAQPWLLVLGRHQWVLDLAGAVLVAAGLWAAHRLARLVLPAGAAAIAVASVIVFPGFLRDATTFMTDAPAFAVEALCLLAGVGAATASGRRRAVLLAACLALGWWGFTIREFAIAAPLAVLITLAMADRARRRRIVLAGGGLVVACGLVYLWRQGLPGQQPYTGRPPILLVLSIIVSSYFTAALGLVPALLATTSRWWGPVDARARIRGVAIGAVLVLVPPAAAWRLGGSPAWLVGDYLDRKGINGDKLLLGSRPVLVPAALWDVVTVVALVAGVALMGLLVERGVAWLGDRREREVAPALAVLRWYVAVLAVALGAAAFLNGALFDRYLWPVIFAGSILLLALPRRDGARGGARQRPVAAAMAVVVLACLSVAIAANSDAYDAARWNVGSAEVAKGLAPTSVDAGFEWVGAHSQARADVAARVGGDPHQSWWTKMFSLSAPCVEVANSPVALPGYALTRTSAWEPLLVAGRARLYVYQRAGCT